jgi:Cupin
MSEKCQQETHAPQQIASVFPGALTVICAPKYNCTGCGSLSPTHWQYYIERQARVGVFGSQGAARTFDYRAGDVGYVPFGMGHYVENIGNTPVRFLETFRSSYFADLSLNQCMALTPPQLLQAHFPLDQTVMENLHKKKYPIVSACWACNAARCFSLVRRRHAASDRCRRASRARPSSGGDHGLH